jgi:hypothetical protein
MVFPPAIQRRASGFSFIPLSGFRFWLAIVRPVGKEKNQGRNFPHLRKICAHFERKSRQMLSRNRTMDYRPFASQPMAGGAEFWATGHFPDESGWTLSKAAAEGADFLK